MKRLSIFSSVLLLLVFTSSFTNAKEGDRSVLPLSKTLFKHFHILYQGPDWIDGNLCTHWVSADVDFDWVPGTLPANVVISNGVEHVDCSHHFSSYARTSVMHFDTDAHVISMSFSDRGDFSSDQKLKDPTFLSQMMSVLDGQIDDEK